MGASRWSVVAVLVGTGVVALGCSDPGRTIATAKKLGDSELETPSQIPPRPAPAQSDPGAKALVAQLLNAHTKNKPEAAAAFKSFEYVRSGSIISFGQGGTAQTWTVRGSWPQRFHVRAEFPNQMTIALVWNGDKGWRQQLSAQANAAEDLPVVEVKHFHADVTGEWLALLFPLLEPETIVAEEPAKLTRGKTLSGVRVWHPALSEAILYIDPATKELAEITFNGRESGQLVVKQFFLLEAKETAGVKLVTHLAQNANGKQLADWTYTRIEPKTHDAKIFEKP